MCVLSDFLAQNLPARSRKTKFQLMMALPCKLMKRLQYQYYLSIHDQLQDGLYVNAVPGQFSIFMAMAMHQKGKFSADFLQI